MEAIISAADQAAWAGKSLVDATMPQRPDMVILRNPVANVRVAGISDLPRDRLTTIINRGPFDVTLMANDAAAPPPLRFPVQKLLPAGKKTSLFYNELGIAPIAGKDVVRTTPVVGASGSHFTNSVAAITWNQTIAAGDNLLVAFLVFQSGVVSNSATFNGIPMTILLNNFFGGAGMFMHIAFLVNPPVGTFPVSFGFPSAFIYASAVSVALKDVDTANPFGALGAAGMGNPTGSVSSSPATKPGQLVLGFGARRDLSSVTNFAPPTPPEVLVVGAANSNQFANITQRPATEPTSLILRTSSDADAVMAVTGVGVNGKPVSPLKVGLSSYWKMDEAAGDALDAHGTNHLTDNGTVGSAAGKVGNARDFEKDNAEFFSRADPSLWVGNAGFTFAFWMKPETPTSGISHEVITKDLAGARELLIHFSGNKMNLLHFGSPGPISVAPPQVLDVGSWYFVVAWHDPAANLAGMSINGADTTAAAPAGWIATGPTASQFQIGARQYAGFPEYYDGLIDEVGFWKRALTLGERSRLYNGGVGLAYEDF